ncbi:uncharacterized protein [Montipora capricornis]|uniref:uncharacterized protein n=1 Tax=Montipora foliosa TaxID=591990 RepID=UPI0035F1A6B8
MATRKLLVRVMNDPNNKRTFKKFRIEEFPEMDVQSTTRMLVDMYGEHLGFSEAERAEIGYIGYSNKKFKITSNDDLQRAFESGELHKNQQAVFYICRKQEESASKRTAKDVAQGKTAPVQVSPDDSETDSDDSSKNKRPRKQSKGKSLEKTIERLRSIHEDKWGLGEYRLWATALERGHHSSYQEPPDYPVFSNTSKKRTKSASELTQALTEVASVFLKSSRSDVSSHAEQASADKATYNRTELLKQMQMLSELYQSGALSKEEFEEQKKNVLRDISKC